MSDLAKVVGDAKNQIQAGNPEAAVEQLNLHKNKWPKNLLLPGVLAEAHAKTGNFACADEILTDLINKHDIETVPAWVCVCHGNAQERLKKPESSCKSFLIALEKDFNKETLARILKLLTYIPGNQALVDQTVAIVESTVIDSSNGEKQLYKIGCLSKQIGNHEIAYQLFSKALESSGTTPSTSTIRNLISSQIRLQHYSGAIESIEKYKDLETLKNSLIRYKKIAKFRQSILPHIEDLKSLFFPAFYRTKYSISHMTNEEAFNHFLNTGITQRMDPNPWFNHKFFEASYSENLPAAVLPLIHYIENEKSNNLKPSSAFDPQFYRVKYPDLSETPCVLSHYCQFGHSQGFKAKRRKLPEAILSEFEEMTFIEPQLVNYQHGLNRIVRYPKVTPSVFLPRIINQKIKSKIEAIVCVPFISRGGADLVATFALKSLQERYGTNHVLLIVTDSRSVELDSWIDKDTPILVLDEEFESVDIDDKTFALHNAIGQFNPRLILNVNSLACWRLFKFYGKQLSSVTSLYAYLFCYDQNIANKRVGYITDYLSDTIKYMESVFFDNQTILKEITLQYSFSDDNLAKLHCVYTPNSNSVKPIDLNTSAENILWIGRLCRQKRPDTLIEIAKRLPEQTFHVYGTPGDSNANDAILLEQLPNIVFKGTFDSISELDFTNYYAFLHTSEWEGLPTILITVMSIGLPIISSDVGGVGELVSEKTGWPVTPFDDIDQYCTLINRAYIDKSSTKERISNGIELINKRHTWQSFTEALESTGFLPTVSTEEKKASETASHQAAT